MAVVYSILDWAENFEVAQAKKVKTWTWVATPLKHDGKSFRRIMLMPDGLEIFASWMLLVQMAAKCPTRGVLADASGPLDAEDFAIKTGAPKDKFENALKVLCSDRIGWMCCEEWEGGGIALVANSAQTDRQTDPTNLPTSDAGCSQQGGQAGGGSLELTWEAVGNRLAALDMVQWSQAIEQAKAAGCFPRVAHQLIDHAQRYGFGPGAIAKRFAIAAPTLGINVGWPNTETPESAEQKRVQKSVDRRAKHAAEQAERQAWDVINAGKKARKSYDEVQAECESQGLPWPNPAVWNFNGKALAK